MPDKQIYFTSVSHRIASRHKHVLGLCDICGCKTSLLNLRELIGAWQHSESDLDPFCSLTLPSDDKQNCQVELCVVLHHCCHHKFSQRYTVKKILREICLDSSPFVSSFSKLAVYSYCSSCITKHKKTLSTLSSK